MEAQPCPPKEHGTTVTLRNLNQSLNFPKVDVFHFADALEKFGLCDLAFIAQQAKRRLEFVDYLNRLASGVAARPCLASA